MTSSAFCARFQSGLGIKSTVPTSCFGSAGEPKTYEQLSAASWETSHNHALKHEVDFDFRFCSMRIDD